MHALVWLTAVVVLVIVAVDGDARRMLRPRLPVHQDRMMEVHT